METLPVPPRAYAGCVRAIVSYVLLRGAAADLTGSAGGWPDQPDLLPVHPAFVWPADHAWCFVSDVDPHWAGIGADRGVIDRLVANTRFDVVRADPEERQPTYC